MKKFWILNFVITLVILAIAVIVNNKFYLTPTDFYSGVICTILLISQFIFCIIYVLKNLSKYTTVYFIVTAIVFFFQIMALLFIINGILWNTDTGSWSI